MDVVLAEAGVAPDLELVGVVVVGVAERAGSGIFGEGVGNGLLARVGGVDGEDGPFRVALEVILAHLGVELGLVAVRVGADEGVEAVAVPRMRDGGIDEADEVEEVDVGRVVGR